MEKHCHLDDQESRGRLDVHGPQENPESLCQDPKGIFYDLPGPGQLVVKHPLSWVLSSLGNGFIM